MEEQRKKEIIPVILLLMGLRLLLGVAGTDNDMPSAGDWILFVFAIVGCALAAAGVLFLEKKKK